VSSILAHRSSDERGLRLAQSLCPGVKVKVGSGEVLAPTVLKRDDSFIELSDGVRTARLLTSAHKGGAIIEVLADFDDSKVEQSMLAALVGVVDKACHAAGTVFVPHQDRNLVGVPLGEACGVLAA